LSGRRHADARFSAAVTGAVFVTDGELKKASAARLPTPLS